MSARSLLAPLVAVIAVAIAAPAESRAAETAAGARAKGKRVVVSPRPGQVVRRHHVRVRVRSRTLTDTLRVRLNGKQIGADFARPRRGARSLRASRSHGLRRGRNVLRVTVRPRRGAVRTAKVPFTVRTKRHFVGAGRDRLLAVGGKVRIRGAVAPRGAKLRWRVVRAPRRSRAHTALLAGKPPHTLTSPGGRTAAFRPRVPGTYRLRLSAGSGSRAASDVMTVDVAPRSKLVPIETMTTEDTGNGDQRGIRVGSTTYRLRDARGFASVETSVLQVLVLERSTLGFVSNTIYTDLARLKDDLGKLEDSKLVTVVAQPNSPFCCPSFNFDGVLGRIGVADSGAVLLAGELSAIGVPGMAPGDADVNATRKKGDPVDGNVHIRPAPMTGYLTPDQWGSFGFVPKARVPFSFGPKPPPSCTRDCIDGAGLRIRHLDVRSGAPAAHDGQLYRTQYADQAKELAADLEAMPEGNVVMVEAVGNRTQGQPYFPPVGAHDRATMVALAEAVAQVGGTRNAFNRIARRPGSDANGGMTYALVGWKGAGEGAGAEVAAGVEGAGEAPRLSGVLRPDRQSLLRPVEGDAEPEALTNLVMDEPQTTWPLDDNRGARSALSCLGSTHSKLGPDPRPEYARQPFDQAQWNDIAREIEGRTYANARTSCTRDGLAPVFTEAQFRAARDQLVQELRWVGNVRAYLANLAKPIAGSEVMSYAKVLDIAARVHKEATPPDDESTMRWLEFAEILLELAGPVTHEVSSTVAGVMELGVWMFGANEKGGAVDEIPFKADELGDEIVAQMKQTVEMYTRMGDVIVTDPAKLRFVGENGGCSPEARGCPEGWSFTSDDVTAVKADIQRTVERTAWEELLPLGFAVYKFNPERLDRAPDPRWYNCSVYPYWYWSDTAVSRGTTPLLLELDPQNAGGSLWRLLSLARPGGVEHSSSFRAQPPSDTALERVFGPISPSTSPDEGGLGVSLARLLPEDEWSFWAPTPWFRPVKDNCS